MPKKSSCFNDMHFAGQVLQIVVPAGVTSGQILSVNVPDGRQLTFEVPPGSPPGSELQLWFDPAAGTVSPLVWESSDHHLNKTVKSHSAKCFRFNLTWQPHCCWTELLSPLTFLESQESHHFASCFALCTKQFQRKKRKISQRNKGGILRTTNPFLQSWCSINVNTSRKRHAWTKQLHNSQVSTQGSTWSHVRHSAPLQGSRGELATWNFLLPWFCYVSMSQLVWSVVFCILVSCLENWLYSGWGPTWINRSRWGTSVPFAHHVLKDFRFLERSSHAMSLTRSLTRLLPSQIEVKTSQYFLISFVSYCLISRCADCGNMVQHGRPADMPAIAPPERCRQIHVERLSRKGIQRCEAHFVTESPVFRDFLVKLRWSGLSLFFPWAHWSGWLQG